MKHLFLVFLWTQFTFAASLSDYRSCYFKEPQKIKSYALQRTQEILKELEMQHLPEINLKYPKGSGEPRRRSYSTVVKSILSDGMNKALEKFSKMAVTPIDPSLTKEEVAFYQKSVRAHAIMRIFNNKERVSSFKVAKRTDSNGNFLPIKDQSALTGIEAVVNDFYNAALIAKSKEDLKGNNISRKFPIGYDQEQAKKIIKNYISQYAPLNKNGKSIFDILGEDITQVEVDEGYINEIQFNKPIKKDGSTSYKKETQVSAQLNMFLTSLIGEESIYTEVQEVLFTYLKSQEKILKERKEEVENRGYELKEDKPGLLAQIAMGVGTATGNPSIGQGLASYFFEQKKQNLADFNEHDFEMAQKLIIAEYQENDLNESYTYKYKNLNKFYEGKAIAGQSSEIEFINRRLSALKVALPYLTEMVGKTVYTNHVLSQELSEEQLKFMAAMFLKLRYDDIISYTESTQSVQMFKYAYESCELKNQNDIAFYYLQDRLLSALKIKLDENKMSKEALKNDLEDIRSGNF